MLMLSVMCRHPDRGQVAGVLEVIQTSEDMVFSDLVEIISQVPAGALWVYMCLCLGSLQHTMYVLHSCTAAGIVS